MEIFRTRDEAREAGWIGIAEARQMIRDAGAHHVLAVRDMSLPLGQAYGYDYALIRVDESQGPEEAYLHPTILARSEEVVLREERNKGRRLGAIAPMLRADDIRAHIERLRAAKSGTAA